MHNSVDTNTLAALLFYVFAAFSINLPRWKERPQTAVCFREWLGRLKCHMTGLEVSLALISTFLRCLWKWSPNLQPVSPMYIILHKVHLYLCTGRVGETIKRKGGVSQACLGKSTSFIPSQYFRMLLQFKVK